MLGANGATAQRKQWQEILHGAIMENLKTNVAVWTKNCAQQGGCYISKLG